MKFFDAGSRAMGFIAVGQEATGFFAFGQMATGVIAIGQLARGGFAVGQAAIGLVGWGQGGVGIFHAVGMIGVGGRGFGIVLPLVPSIGRPRVLPPKTSFADVEAGGEGWIEVQLGADLSLSQDGVTLPIKIDRRLQKRGREIVAEGSPRVLAYTRRVGSILVCDRIAHEPLRPYQKPAFRVLAALQILGLFGLGIGYVAVVGHDLVTALARIVDDGPPPQRRPPPVRPRPRTR